MKYAAPAFRTQAEEISRKIAEGARARQAAERQRREIKTKLEGLEREIEQLRVDAKRDAEAEAQRLRDLGRAEAEKIEQAARAEMDAAARAARMELEIAGRAPRGGTRGSIAAPGTRAQVRSRAAPRFHRRAGEERPLSAVAERYAAALADVALERKSGEAVRQDLAAFVEIFSSADLRNALESPAVDGAVKNQVISAIAAKMGLNEAVLDIVYLLVDHRRTHLFHEIRKCSAQS